jgi:hypothetical protein
MKNTNRISLALAFAAALLLPAIAPAQVLVSGVNSFNTTTLSAAQSMTATSLVVASATGFTIGDALYIDGEVEIIGGKLPYPPYAAYAGGTTVPVFRTGSQGGAQVGAHVSGAIVVRGLPRYFNAFNPTGACPVPVTNGGTTPATVPTSPWVNTRTGDIFRCYGTPSQWGKVGVFFVPAGQCNWIPTTLTQTTTFPVTGLGATLFMPVSNSVTSAAAGTDTLNCWFVVPSEVGQLRTALLTDITVGIGSQVVAPTSLGTATLTSITFPTPVATTQTATTQTVTAAVGGTVTQIGPTTTVLSVTTAGDFLTFNYQFSAPVDLTTDLRMLNFTLPILQSAASAMTLNTNGLFVHYLTRPSVLNR